MHTFSKAAPFLGIAALAALGLGAALPAAAQTTYFYSDAIIDAAHSVTGNAEFGSNDGRFPPASPTVSIVTGGSVGGGVNVFSNSTVNINGGSVGAANFDGLIAFDTSTVNVSGGTITNLLEADSNSTVNVSGGSIGNYLGAAESGTINISGGSVAQGLLTQDECTVTVSGGTFGPAELIGSPGPSYNFEDYTTGAFTFVGTGLTAVDIGPGAYGGTYYRLTGLLQSGQSVTGDVVDVVPGARMFSGVTILAPAPEPSAFAGLALGALSLACLTLKARRRQPNAA